MRPCHLVGYGIQLVNNQTIGSLKKRQTIVVFSLNVWQIYWELIYSMKLLSFQKWHKTINVFWLVVIPQFQICKQSCYFHNDWCEKRFFPSSSQKFVFSLLMCSAEIKEQQSDTTLEFLLIFSSLIWYQTSVQTTWFHLFLNALPWCFQKARLRNIVHYISQSCKLFLQKLFLL